MPDCEYCCQGSKGDLQLGLVVIIYVEERYYYLSI